MKKQENSKPVRLTAPTLSILLQLSKAESAIWGLELVRLTGLKTGTVYPILARLESYGWAECSWEVKQSHKGPRRRLWKLTKDGRREAENIIRAKSLKMSLKPIAVSQPKTAGLAR